MDSCESQLNSLFLWRMEKDKRKQGIGIEERNI